MGIYDIYTGNSVQDYIDDIVTQYELQLDDAGSGVTYVGGGSARERYKLCGLSDKSALQRRGRTLPLNGQMGTLSLIIFGIIEQH